MAKYRISGTVSFPFTIELDADSKDDATGEVRFIAEDEALFDNRNGPVDIEIHEVETVRPSRAKKARG